MFTFAIGEQKIISINLLKNYSIMKKNLLIIALVGICVCFASCKQNNNPGGEPAAEEPAAEAVDEEIDPNADPNELIEKFISDKKASLPEKLSDKETLKDVGIEDGKLVYTVVLPTEDDVWEVSNVDEQKAKVKEQMNATPEGRKVMKLCKAANITLSHHYVVDGSMMHTWSDLTPDELGAEEEAK